MTYELTSSQIPLIIDGRGASRTLRMSPLMRGPAGPPGPPGPPGTGGGGGGTNIPLNGTPGQYLALNNDLELTWKDIPEATLITETLTSVVGSDVLVILRDDAPYLVSLSTLSSYLGSPPSIDVPEAMIASQWTATAGIESISLAILSSPNNGGSAITGFQYQLNNGPWVSFSGTTHNITGLSAAAYAVRIRAVNIVGSGAASDTKTRTPTEASAGATAPAAFTAGQWTVTAGEGRFVLNINALPNNGGSTVTAIQYRLDAGAWVNLSGTATGSRTITGLNPQTYSVQIRAVNSIGNGPNSDTKSVTPTVVIPVDPVEHVVSYGANSDDDGLMIVGTFNQYGTFFGLPDDPDYPGGATVNVESSRIPAADRTVAMLSPMTDDLPVGAIIDFVEFDLNVESRWLSPELGVAMATRPVVLDVNISPTMSLYAPGQSWGGAGASGVGDIGPQLSSAGAITADGPVTIPSTPELVAAVQEWADGPRTTQMWFVLQEGDEGQGLTLSGRNITEVADGLRPRIRIGYTA